jgi:hypothetical protein
MNQPHLPLADLVVHRVEARGVHPHQHHARASLRLSHPAKGHR